MRWLLRGDNWIWAVAWVGAVVINIVVRDEEADVAIARATLGLAVVIAAHALWRRWRARRAS